jgi:hypothetical protein
MIDQLSLLDVSCGGVMWFKENGHRVKRKFNRPKNIDETAGFY